MAFFPISHTGVQYVDTNGDPFSGAVLKAFAAGTTNNIVMATDSSGATTASSMALNADGYPEVSSTIVIPHINEKYKLSLFPTQAAADSNTGAIWTQDNISVSIDFGSTTQEISTSTVLDSSDANTHINFSGTITTTLPDIDVVGSGYVFSWRNSGVGVVTFDADGSETINGALTQATQPGTGGWMISGETSWSLFGDKDAQIDTVNTFANTQSWTKGADIVSATTLVLGTDGNYFDVTGNTGPIGTITVAAGTPFILQFDSTPVLTHNGTNLDLPGEADITAAVGDSLIGFATAANQVHVISYTRADGRAVVSYTPQIEQSNESLSGTAIDFTIPAGITEIEVFGIDLSFDAEGANYIMQIGDSGGIETSGYVGNYSNDTGNSQQWSSSAILNEHAAAADISQCKITLTLVRPSANTWYIAASGANTNSTQTLESDGHKSLSAELTTVRITSSNGTPDFDAGAIYLRYSTG